MGEIDGKEKVFPSYRANMTRGSIVEHFFVTGWTAIGDVFGVTGKRVREWHAMGAPLLWLGRKPVADMGVLWAWLVEHRAEVEQGGS